MRAGKRTVQAFRNMADLALVCFIRVVVEVYAAPQLQAYCMHKKITRVFGTEFEIKLGFGLHMGWSIEGPIGSNYKIDASYLSPNVHLAETLESLTKAYDARILMSGEFHALLSPAMQLLCRLVDVIYVAGRHEPLCLYTFDISDRAIELLLQRTDPVGYAALLETRPFNVENTDGFGSPKSPYSAVSQSQSQQAESASTPPRSSHCLVQQQQQQEQEKQQQQQQEGEEVGGQQGYDGAGDFKEQMKLDLNTLPTSDVIGSGSNNTVTTPRADPIRRPMLNVATPSVSQLHQHQHQPSSSLYAFGNGGTIVEPPMSPGAAAVAAAIEMGRLGSPRDRRLMMASGGGGASPMSTTNQRFDVVTATPSGTAASSSSAAATAVATAAAAGAMTPLQHASNDYIRWSNQQQQQGHPELRSTGSLPPWPLSPVSAVSAAGSLPVASPSSVAGSTVANLGSPVNSGLSGVTAGVTAGATAGVTTGVTAGVTAGASTGGSAPTSLLSRHASIDMGRMVLANNPDWFDNVRRVDLDHLSIGYFVRGESLDVLQIDFDRLFHDEHQRGMLHYIRGNWATATTHFEEALRVLNREDKATRSLLTYMAENGVVVDGVLRAPSSWKKGRPPPDD